ncbi:MAG: hypothetical protein A4E53_04131 [Pelotomaculum sp. PtaB.Bin104]|nr:MAG: hypothetical protein A4E53_04131 [Pelotomaculum sp. PtaB.Bin104]
MKKYITVVLLICVALLIGCSKENKEGPPVAANGGGAGSVQAGGTSPEQDKGPDKKADEQNQPGIALNESMKASEALLNLAEKEKETLSQLDAIARDIEVIYGDWNSGRINRQQFSDRCLEKLAPANRLKNDFNNFLSNNPLTDQDKENPLYDGGLKLMKDMNLYICGFLSESIKGNHNFPVKEWANAAPNTDERVRSLYTSLIAENYRGQYMRINEAISICLAQK